MKKTALAALALLISFFLPSLPAVGAAPPEIILPAGQLPPSPPATPLVKDAGDWCKDKARLHVTWETPTQPNTPPVLEYQYRVRDRDSGLIKGTTAAGLHSAADIALPLQQGHKYFVEVRARNAAGWSKTGASDGITADLQAPRVGINSFLQTTVTLSGGRIYPNSFQVSLAGSDTGGSGFDKYLLTIGENISLQDLSAPQSLRSLPTGPYIYSREVSAAEAAAPIALSNLPYLYNGRSYTLVVKGVDQAGNIGEAARQDCVVHFAGALFPPLAKIRVLDQHPPKVVWEEVIDAAAGIAEYQVAISVGNKPESWRRVGNALEYQLSQSPGKDWQVWVKAINGFGRESVSSLGRHESKVLPWQKILNLPNPRIIFSTPSK